MRNDESKSVSMKGVIVHLKKNQRMVIMITIKRHMHIWHGCLVNVFLLEILVTVINRPIGF